MVTRARLAAGALAVVTIAACGEEAAVIPFDSVSVESSAPTTTTVDLGAALPPPSVTGSPLTNGTGATTGASTPASPSPAITTSTTGPATSAPWVQATSNLAGMESECGNLTFVSARPDEDVVIAGVALQGLWASADGAEDWTALGQGPGSEVITNRMSAIVYDPEQPGTFYESGIYNAGGVYKTVDGGATFEQLGDVTHSDLVSVDFGDPARATLLSGRHESPTLFRSTDAGATWRDISAALPADIGYAVAPHVLDAQTHLLGTQRGAAAGVLRTTDGGGTWTVVHEGGVSGPVLAASDGGLYWLLEGGAGLITSDDDGATWSVASGPGVVSANSASLLELPDGRFATFGDRGLLLSSDRGTTWQSFGSPFPYVPNGIAYAAQRAAFYIWRFDCSAATANPVADDAIMRLDVDPDA